MWFRIETSYRYWFKYKNVCWNSANAILLLYCVQYCPFDPLQIWGILVNTLQTKPNLNVLDSC